MLVQRQKLLPLAFRVSSFDDAESHFGENIRYSLRVTPMIDRLYLVISEIIFTDIYRSTYGSSVVVSVTGIPMASIIILHLLILL